MHNGGNNKNHKGYHEENAKMHEGFLKGVFIN